VEKEMKRTGERVGWIAGWVGTYCWLLYFGIRYLWRGNFFPGTILFFLPVLGIVLLSPFSPWKYPSTKYWKLLTVPYLILIAGMISYIWAEGGMNSPTMKWYNILILLFAFLPIFTMWNKTWESSAVITE
jgi:hypothetical protein